MRYLSHTPKDTNAMLKTMGKSSLDELFTSIPKQKRLDKPLNIPAGLSELELKRELAEKAGNAPKLSFLGAGATAHYVPELVSQQLLRGEWYTAYTPYQPEMAQGTLQAIFEFQTMTASLLGCEIANASMYDGATALAEALLMAMRLKAQKTELVLSLGIHPEYREVCHTYLKHKSTLIDLPLTANAITSVEQLEKLFTTHQNIAAVAYQTPNFLGQLEEQQKVIDCIHAHGAIAIAVTTDPTAFARIRSPGHCGADIVVGEGLSLCGHTSLGAPGVGLFATKKQFVRQMPGRLCGATIDAAGNRGFVLTLSTREQHIRRENATSNICTNHNLMALAFTMALSLYGKQGLKQLSDINISKTYLLRKLAHENNLSVAFHGPFYNETVLRFSSEQVLQQKLRQLAKKDIFAGVALSKWYPEYSGCLLVNTIETHRDEDVELLVKELAS